MNARRIILCADDYGISPAVSAAIRDLIARRRINATSVMVGTASFSPSEAHALAGVAATHAAIGLHVTLTGPFRPLSSDFAPLHDGAFPMLAGMAGRALARRLDAAALTLLIAPITSGVAQTNPTMTNVVPDGGEFAAQGKIQALDPGAGTLVLVAESGSQIPMTVAPGVT